MLRGEPAFARALAAPGDNVRLMVIYGIGFIVVFATLSLMHLNVLRCGSAMQLTPLETFEAKAGAIHHLATASIGVLSIAIVLVGGDEVAGYSGISYRLIGVAHGVLGHFLGKRRSQLRAQASPAV